MTLGDFERLFFNEMKHSLKNNKERKLTKVAVTFTVNLGNKGAQWSFGFTGLADTFV